MFRKGIGADYGRDPHQIYLIPSYGALGIAIAFGTSWITLMVFLAIYVFKRKVINPEANIG